MSELNQDQKIWIKRFEIMIDSLWIDYNRCNNETEKLKIRSQIDKYVLERKKFLNED